MRNLKIVLLSIDLDKSKSIDTRYLDFYLEKNNVKCKRIPMSRRLLTRLATARKSMMKYYSAPSGTELAACVRKLEELSFENLAFQLEESELKKHPEFRSSFEQAVK